MKQPLFNLLRHDWFWGSILFLVTLIAYQPSWNGKPIWDDSSHITKPELRSLNGLTRIWTELGATQQYYPVVHSAFWLAYHLWGENTLWYHLLNILLHIFSALLIVKILRFLKIPGAWVAAYIFALHPVQVESVAWITELKNTLSGVFFLSTALVYLKFDTKRTKKLYGFALCLFVFGLLSKSVIATLPVSLLAVFWWKRGKISWSHDVLPLLPFFIGGIASGLFTAWVESTFIIGSETSEFTATAIERCLIAGRAVWFYLSKLFGPVNLIFIYPRWNVSQYIGWQYLFPCTALLLAATLWIFRKRSRAPFAVLICFTATLFPVLGFFNVYPFRYSYVADHFQYLACIGPTALFTAAFCFLFVNHRRWRFILYIFFAIVLFTLTRKQCSAYASSEIIYRTVIAKNPTCLMAHNNLGYELLRLGRTTEALSEYKKALDLKPDFAESWNNLGNALSQSGQINKAIVHFQRALEIKPAFVEAMNNLGNALLQTGQKNEALAIFQKALKINPGFAETYNNYGILLDNIGRAGEAIAAFQKALEINPRYWQAHNNFGIVLEKSGRTSEALNQYQLALQIDPSFAEAHKNIGTLLAKTGRTEDALTHLHDALKINPMYTDAYNNLGMLLALIGRPDEAIANFQKVLAYNPLCDETYFNLGNISVQIGHSDEAIANYQKALEINPTNIGALQNLAFVFAQKDMLIQSTALFRKALELAKKTGNDNQIKEISESLEKVSQANKTPQ